ncbi:MULTISPECIES: CoA transferase [unclassified Sphingomonas]|uniref:CoA transferase n=1 Tax=unclassified Sphingomonas TaxID=196159 RepID=UPI000832089B|nr:MULTISPECIES: CoA transferase [unclassified Sphingomonas]
MSDTISHALLGAILDALAVPRTASGRVTFSDEDRLPSCFAVSELAAASIAAACLSVSELVGVHDVAPPVAVSHRLTSLWFGWSIRPLGWEMPTPWDAIAGDYQVRDGWIKLHTNAPHHRAAALGVLGCAPDRAAVAACVAQWQGDALESAIIAAGGCAARLRTIEQWSDHPQGIAAAHEPLILWDTPAAPGDGAWRPTPGRPLAGLRVLDLTRVLAGPVATRFLAGFGADVLRIDPPDWDEPAVAPEVTLGKRCARLDLRTAAGRASLAALLGRADILVHGYRSDALDRLGFGAAERQAIRPGLIDISLDAYGHSGPWSRRRGFDSLVQFSCGIAASGQVWRGADRPVSLPVQALDHATGYLLAAAAVRALIARTTGAGATAARLSLARTAKLLVDHPGEPMTGDMPPPDDADYAPDVEPTAWGPAQRLRPPAVIAGHPMRWDRPAVRLGSDSAE